MFSCTVVGLDLKHLVAWINALTATQTMVRRLPAWQRQHYWADAVASLWLTAGSVYNRSDFQSITTATYPALNDILTSKGVVYIGLFVQAELLFPRLQVHPQ